MSYILLAAAIVFESAGTICLRASHGFERKAWIFPLFALTLASFIALSLALREGMPIGVAYGIWAALGIALTSTLGHFFYREHFNLMMAAGITLISVGAILIEVGGK